MAKKKTTTRAAAPAASKASSNGTTKKVASTAAVKIPRAEKPRSKAELYAVIADQTGLSKAQVNSVFTAMSEVMAKDLNKRSGPEAFTVPGLMKVTVNRKPATKARKGRNPFTGEEIMIKAKPARNVLKVRPLKTMKEMV